MHADSRTSRLDARVEYGKQVIIVAATAVGAFWSVTLASDVALPWAVFLFGAAIAYALFLPYRRAALVEEKWSLVAKIRALDVILMGLPVYVIPSVAVIRDSSLAASLPGFQAALASLQFESQFLNLIASFVLGGLLASALTSVRGSRWLLRKSGYGIEEIRSVNRYIEDHVFRLELGLAGIVVATVLYISAGWYYRNQSALAVGYYYDALWLIGLLVVYGYFFVTYVPALCRPRSRRFLEAILFLSLLGTFVSTPIGVTFALPALVGLHVMSEKGRSKTSPDTLIEQKRREEISERVRREEENMKRDIKAWHFYKLYPKIEVAIVGIFGACIMTFSLFMILAYQLTFIQLLGIMLLFTLLYYGIPRMYFRWLSFSRNLEKLKEQIETKQAEGAFDL